MFRASKIYTELDNLFNEIKMNKLNYLKFKWINFFFILYELEKYH